MEIAEYQINETRRALYETDDFRVSNLLKSHRFNSRTWHLMADDSRQKKLVNFLLQRYQREKKLIIPSLYIKNHLKSTKKDDDSSEDEEDNKDNT